MDTYVRVQWATLTYLALRLFQNPTLIGRSRRFPSMPATLYYPEVIDFFRVSRSQGANQQKTSKWPTGPQSPLLPQAQLVHYLTAGFLWPRQSDCELLLLVLAVVQHRHFFIGFCFTSIVFGFRIIVRIDVRIVTIVRAKNK